MKTENEIKALPLEEQQKLIVDLKQVPVSDKYYETAQRLIKFITGLKTYKPPVEIEVKNISSHTVTVDGRVIEPEQMAKVFPWQFAALRRFLEEPGKVAALLLFAFLFAFGLPAGASSTIAIGNAGSYNVSYVAGLGGGTNNLPTNTTATFTAPVTNVLSIITNISTSILNGTTSWTTNYTTNTTVAVPGVFTIPPGAPFTLSFGGLLVGTAATVTAKVDYSPDGVMWQTNVWAMPLSPSGEVTCTNVQVPAMAGGYGRLNMIVGGSTSGLTNIFFDVAKPQ